MSQTKVRKTYISKGQRPNITRATINMVAKSRDYSWKLANKIKAWRLGKNPWVTVENPEAVNGLNRNKPFIRLRANVYFGNPKEVFIMGLNDKTNKKIDPLLPSTH